MYGRGVGKREGWTNIKVLLISDSVDLLCICRINGGVSLCGF